MAERNAPLMVSRWGNRRGRRQFYEGGASQVNRGRAAPPRHGAFRAGPGGWPGRLTLVALALLAAAPAAAQGDSPEPPERPPAAAMERHRLRVDWEFGTLYPFDLGGTGRQDLVVVENDRTRRDVRSRLAVYRHEAGGFRRLPERLPLPADLVLAGVGRFPQGPGLVVLTPERVAIHWWRGRRFAPVPEPTRAVTSVFPKPPGEPRTELELVADVDGDGLSEIVVPRVDGFDILTVTPAGALARHSLLRTRPDGRILNYFRRKLIAYQLPALSVVDGRDGGPPSLLAYNDGLVHWFPGSPAPGPDGVRGGRVTDLQPPRPFDPKAPRDPPMLLVRAGDLNADGLPDLVLTKTAAADRSFNSDTRVLVYYGRPGADGAPVAFGADPDQVYRVEGFSVPILLDADRDGTVDMVLVNVEVGFWNTVKALIAQTVNADAAFYHMPRGGRYPREPDALEAFSVKFSLGRYTHQPIATFGDFNGDGLPDLLLSREQNRLGVHWGRPGAFWDVDPDAGIEDHLPTRDRRVLVRDLDGDGRDDLVFTYNRDDIRQMPEMERRITVLLSRFPVPPGRAARGGGLVERRP